MTEDTSDKAPGPREVHPIGPLLISCLSFVCKQNPAVHTPTRELRSMFGIGLHFTRVAPLSSGRLAASSFCKGLSWSHVVFLSDQI